MASSSPAALPMQNDNVVNINDDCVDVVDKEKQGEKSSEPSQASTVASNAVSASVSSDKRKRSRYWDHFDKVGDQDDGKYRCKYCFSSIKALSKNGTSGLKNHIERCKKYPSNIEKKQKQEGEFEKCSIVDKDGNVQVVTVPKCWEFSHEEARGGVAIMVILDELPFSFVEHEGFHEFCKRMNPSFIPPSRRTVTRDCYGLFIHERGKMKRIFSKFSGRVSLTTDTWTSCQNLCYMCLTAHYIDDDWTLHKKILNFCHIAGHSGEFIGKAVEKCLIIWGIKNVMTITVDNASANDSAIKYLRRRLNHMGGSVLNGQYLHMRCATHILNLIVKDGLKELNDSIMKIRLAVRYVRSSPARLQKFQACVEEENIECKGLVCMDVDTRWNSTYLMLNCAVKFRLAFENLHSKGGQYVKEFEKIGGPPSVEDWSVVNSFLPFLQIFYDATVRLSGSSYVTGNCFVPQLYEVGDMISAQAESPDLGMQRMASRMRLKMDKYWGNVENVNILPFVAFVLDPRHKMCYLEYVLGELYDDEYAAIMKSKVQVTMRSLFHGYNVMGPPLSPGDSIQSSQSSQTLDSSQRLKLQFERKHGTVGTGERKNELDKYLTDEAEPIEGQFDILLPASTVASESAFSTGGRVLDSFRSSLTPRMAEALVCGQDWMRSSHIHVPTEENLLELEAMEAGMEDLILQQPLVEIDETISLLN